MMRSADRRPAADAARWSTGGRSPVAPLTSIDLMARRQPQGRHAGDHAARQRSRAATNATMQYQAQRAASDDHGAARRSCGLAALACSVGAAVMESADDRTWRTLPSDISDRARAPAARRAYRHAVDAGRSTRRAHRR